MTRRLEDVGREFRSLPLDEQRAFDLWLATVEPVCREAARQGWRVQYGFYRAIRGSTPEQARSAIAFQIAETREGRSERQAQLTQRREELEREQQELDALIRSGAPAPGELTPSDWCLVCERPLKAPAAVRLGIGWRCLAKARQQIAWRSAA